MAPKEHFWQVVRLASSHKVQIGSAMGRSAYLCVSPDCLREARRKNRLTHALRTPVPSQVYEELQHQLNVPTVRIDL